MALDRFSNIKEIQETNGVVRGVVWNEKDLDILQLDLKGVSPEQRPVVEIHLYTIGSESSYIVGGCIDDFEIQRSQLYIDYGKACQSLGIERGQFEVVVNVYKNLLGSHNKEFNFPIEVNRNWHLMWSKFYFKKKHYGYIYAFLSTFPYLIRALIKILIFSKNPQQKKIYCARVNGLYNAYMSKKSWYRPKLK